MLTIALFNLLLLLVTGYAFRCGGAPEWCAASMMLVAAAATLATPWIAAEDFQTINWAMFLIDLALWLSLSFMSLYADRFWPIWLAAMQLVAVAAHGARGYDPGILAIAYWWLVNKIAYPMLAILAIGTWRHRLRLMSGLPEYGWTAQRPISSHESSGAERRPERRRRPR